MDVMGMLADLRQERKQIEEIIIGLERLAANRSKRLGRPRAWMAVVKKRGRPLGSKNRHRVGLKPKLLQIDPLSGLKTFKGNGAI